MLWILYGLATISFAFFTSTLLADKYVGVIVPCFFLFICPITAYILTDNAMQTGESNDPDVVIAGLFPVYAMTNAIQSFAASSGDAQGKNGRRLHGRLRTAPLWAPSGCSCSIGSYTPSSSSTAIWRSPIGPGVKQDWLFFTRKSYWQPAKYRSSVESCKKGPESGEGGDVTEERRRVAEEQDDGTDQVKCLGLRKVYPGATNAAVVNVQFGIKHKECFGLLGSNGAANRQQSTYCAAYTRRARGPFSFVRPRARSSTSVLT